MLTDSFFQQGVTHEVCEDYAIHGNNYIILSDGCSNGGGPRIDTDWGARLLCKAAEQHLDKQQKGWEEFTGSVLATAQTQCRLFPNLKPECLTATLLTIQSIKEHFVFFLMGDGCYGGRRKNGTWLVEEFAFASGAPYYLKYEGDEADRKRYFDAFGRSVRRTLYDGKLMAGDETLRLDQQEFDLDASMPYFVAKYPVEEFDFVFGCSDGASSFYRQVRTETSKHNEPVVLTDILRVLFDVRFTHNFLRLQRNWAFKRKTAGTFLWADWHNADDLSAGGIYTGST